MSLKTKHDWRRGRRAVLVSARRSTDGTSERQWQGGRASGEKAEGINDIKKIIALRSDFSRDRHL